MALVFFYQNQGALSQETALSFDLYFGPPQRRLFPLYFLIALAFLAGCLFTLIFLLQDKIVMTSRLRHARKRILALEDEVAYLGQILEEYERADARDEGREIAR